MAMNNISKAQKRLQMIQKQLSRPSISSSSSNSSITSLPSRSPSPSAPEPCNDINDYETIKGHILIHHNFGVMINSYVSPAISPYKTIENNNINDHLKAKKMAKESKSKSSHSYPTPKAIEACDNCQDIAIEEQPEGTPEKEGITC